MSMWDVDLWPYWIVQPLVFTGPGSGLMTGFHRHFGVPEMARSEYGDRARALSALLEGAGGTPIIGRYTIASAATERTVWFLGAASELDDWARRMRLWLARDGVSKVPCFFAERFHDPSPPAQPSYDPRRASAWWAMKARFMFTLSLAMPAYLLSAISEEELNPGRLATISVSTWLRAAYSLR